MPRTPAIPRTVHPCTRACFIAWPLAIASVAGAQWTQFGGPTRDFAAEPVELATSWADDQPRILWQRPLGDGYSSILVDGDTLYTMYRDGDDDVTVALDAATGATRWEHRDRQPIDTTSQAAGYGYGPRSTPLVAGDSLYAAGFNGHLVCLDKGTGTRRWSRELVREFDGTRTRWGYANSPIAHGGNIILPVGGRGSAFVALDRQTGRTAWRRHDFENSYGSPVRINVDGREQMVCLMAREVVAIDPSRGDLLWRHSHEGQWLNNIPNPVFGPDNLLLVTSEGHAGTRVLRLAHDGARSQVAEVWASRKIKVVHRNVIRIGDMACFSSGDFGATVFTAIDVQTGRILWQTRDVERAGMLGVGDKLLMLEENGRLTLATPTPEGLTIHVRRMLLEEKAWTFPTMVGKRLYLRDRKSIMAVELP